MTQVRDATARLTLRRRGDRRRRGRRWLIVGLSVAVSLGVGYLVGVSPALAAQAVTVSGAKVLTKDDVTAAAGILPGTPLVWVDPGPVSYTHLDVYKRQVDDSKATNPHAAAASLGAFEHVVWVAGGQAKGTTFDGLVAESAGRLRAAVVFGVDRGVIADALARHAPEVPVKVLDGSDHGAMQRAVEWAASQARAGDVVLLAPGCASKDMFTDYAARGDAFAAAVARLAG